MSLDRSPLVTVFVAVMILAAAAMACNAPSGATAPPPAETQPPQATPLAPPGSELVTLTPGLPANPMGATNVETHIRSGPGTDYATLGVLAVGLPIRLTGRNADKSWLQVEFSASPDGRAWIFAANVNVNPAVNVDALPVISVPPAPTRTPTPSPTVTPTSRPPTATATPTRRPLPATAPPTVMSILRADKTQLTPGQCTTLRWDVDNVKALYMDFGQGKEALVGHDTRQVCLETTTTYTLEVLNSDDTWSQYAVTITVSGQCGNTPIIARFEVSDSKVKSGKSVIFSWDVLCAQAVFFKEDEGELQPVGGHDWRRVLPLETTVYHLIVIAKDNSEMREEITVKVEK